MTMNTIKRPLLQYYGAKWRVASKLYPAPQHDTIIEPFAGGAGYSLRYPDRKVLLVEKNPILAGIWQYLIKATPAEILAIGDVPDGGTTEDMRIPQEARWLVGFWLGAGLAAPLKRPSKRMRNKPRGREFWCADTRAHIASCVGLIKHWRVLNCGYEDLPAPRKQATWYVDPPYQKAGKHYMCNSGSINFQQLGAWCRSLPGQVIVCENTGADWLPFRHLAHIHANSIPNSSNAHKSAEAIWTNEDGT